MVIVYRMYRRSPESQSEELGGRVESETGETHRERQRRGGWAAEPEKRDGLLFQAPSLPKALLHLAPGL